MKLFVFYDISKNIIRNEVISILFDYGLRRIQYSVFLGNLSRKEIIQLKELLSKIILEQDSLFIFPICQKDFANCKTTPQNLKNFYWGANPFEFF